MYKSIKDAQIIFYDVLRWVLLATIVELLSGLMVSGFIKLLTWGMAYIIGKSECVQIMEIVSNFFTHSQ